MRSRSHHEPAIIGALTEATPGYDRRVSTLDERIKEVCTARGFTEADWLVLAGRSHSLFSSFRVRLGQGAKASIGSDSLEALAKVAGVHFMWLWKGTGPRDVEGFTPYDPRSAARTPSRVAETTASYERRWFTLNLRVEFGRVPELRFGSLVEWPSLLANAQAARPDIAEEVWRLVEQTPLFLPAPPTAGMVVFLADYLARAVAQGVSPS